MWRNVFRVMELTTLRYRTLTRSTSSCPAYQSHRRPSSSTSVHRPSSRNIGTSFTTWDTPWPPTGGPCTWWRTPELDCARSCQDLGNYMGVGSGLSWSQTPNEYNIGLYVISLVHDTQLESSIRVIEPKWSDAAAHANVASCLAVVFTECAVWHDGQTLSRNLHSRGLHSRGLHYKERLTISSDTNWREPI